MKHTYEGILPILKPAGWTSFDVVAKVRRILRERRIGHTGTLDPDVTGVLPLCIGRATRLVEYLQELPKVYEAELTIGYATDTEDASGRVIERAEAVSLDTGLLIETLNRFTGPIEQIPPMYSAVKKDGKRLYELAREGIEVERAARTVTIHEISLLEQRSDGEYPVVRFRVKCSKGTYIRTLCVDIGKALGYPAVMSSLIRTETSGIGLAQCYPLAEIERMAEEGSIEQAFVPIDRAISFLPSITLSDELAAKARNGIAIRLSADQSAQFEPFTEIRGYDSRGFIGILGMDREKQALIPKKIFHPIAAESGR